MPRPRRRPTYYTAITLHDGTVTAAFPIRRPSKQELKQDGRRIDADGVAKGHALGGRELGDARNEERFRFQDILATRLNTRRALRELVAPEIEELAQEVRGLRAQLDRVEALPVREEASPMPTCGPVPTQDEPPVS